MEVCIDEMGCLVRSSFFVVIGNDDGDYLVNDKEKH